MDVCFLLYINSVSFPGCLNIQLPVLIRLQLLALMCCMLTTASKHIIKRQINSCFLDKANSSKDDMFLCCFLIWVQIWMEMKKEQKEEL